MMKKILVAMLAILSMVGVGVQMATVDVVADGDKDTICDSDIDDDLKEVAGCKESTKSVMEVATGLVDFVVGMIGVVTVGVMVYGGVTFLTSQGDANKVKKGQYILIYGAVGLVVCILAFAIVNFVGGAIAK